MTSPKKILFRLLPLGILLIIAAVYYSSNNSGYADHTEKNTVELQIVRHRRTIAPATIHYCKFNQYYDQEEGRCLGVPGGGKVLHIENRRSCGNNVLKPHCRSSLYYHICKRDKSILAQCANRQIFNNRLQRCVYYDSSTLTPSVIPPDDYMHYNHVRVPSCTRSGRFPVPGHCSMFYTCDTNGHRLYQSILKCPQNTGYQVDRGVCNIVADCVNDNSVDTTVCVPDAPDENVESLSLDDAAKGNVQEIPEILKESKASADDPIVEKEENFKTYDDVITTTPVNIMDILSENNYNDNNSDTVSSNNAKPVKEILVPDDIDEKIMHSQVPNLSETVQEASNGGQYEEDESLLGLRITSPSTAELDDAPHSITIPMNTTIKPEYRTNADVKSETTDTVPFSSDSYMLPKITEEIQDVTTERYKNIEDSAVTVSTFNTEAIDPSTISNTPEISPISDVLSTINEKTQDVTTEQYRNNEDSAVTPSNFNTDSIDLSSAPTVNNVPESSTINDMSSNINEKIQDTATEQLLKIDEKIQDAVTEQLPKRDEEMQDAITEQYKNNEDSAVTPSNFNTDSIDLSSAPTVNNVPESSTINDMSSNINEKIQDTATEQLLKIDEKIQDAVTEQLPKRDEEMQDAITEQYKNNEDSAVTPSNFNTDSIDLSSAPTVSNVPESSTINDMSPNIDEKIQDTATEQLPKIDEEMQDAITEQYKNNEDSAVTPSNFNTDSIDLSSAPTISNVPESSTINDMSPNIDEKMQDTATEQLPKIDEEMQDAITEQYKNNEDSAVTPSNFNTDSIDLSSAPTVSNVPESSTINDMSPNIDEKIQDAVTEQLPKRDEEMQDAITEQYRNNEDSAVTPSNFNTDSIDLSSAPTISNVPESSTINDMSPNIDEKMQDTATEQLPKIDEEMQDAITEQYKNNEDSAVTPSNFNTDSIDLSSAPTVSNVPESSTINDMSPNIDEKIQDAVTEQLPKRDEEMQDAITEQYRNNEDSAVTPSNFNTDSIDLSSAPTVSNVPESSTINDMSPNINEKIQDAVTEQLPNRDEEMQDAITEQYRNNEDSAVTPSNFNTDSIDLSSAPTVSNVPESSTINDMSPNIDEKIQDTATEQLPKIDEEMQDAITEQYKNNEDSAVTPSNFNTDSIDLSSAPTISNVPESSTINDMSPNIDENIQDVTTEQYRNNEDSVVMPSNFSTEVVDENPASALNDTSDDPRNDNVDILSSTSTPVIMPPQAGVDQFTTEELSEVTPSIESKFADASLSTPDGVESVSTRYLPENTDDSYLTPTTKSTLISKDITTPMDIATTSSIQDLPISDTDLVTQNGKDSREASPASFTE